MPSLSIASLQFPPHFPFDLQSRESLLCISLFIFPFKSLPPAKTVLFLASLQAGIWRGGGRLARSEVEEEEGASLISPTMSVKRVWEEQSGEPGPGSMGGGEIMAAPCLGKLRL